MKPESSAGQSPFRRWPVLGSWLERSSLRQLAKADTSEAAALLAQGLVAGLDSESARLAREALRALRNPEAIGAACAIWAETRHPELEALLLENSWVAPGPPRLTVLTILKTGQTELAKQGGADLIEPLVEYSEDRDPSLAARAIECLSGLKNTAAIDRFCALWAGARDARKAAILEAGNYVAAHPPLVQVLTLLKQNRLDGFQQAGAELVPALLEACEDRDRTLARRAQAAVAALQNAEAQDAICRAVIESDHPMARDLAKAAGYQPLDPVLRALYFFLTEQWAAYQDLDFDQRWLAVAYDNGSAKLRSRIAEKARRAGRTEWASMLASSRKERRLNAMSDEEWDAVIDVLGESQRWEEIWKLVQTAAGEWSARLLRKLSLASWMPAAETEAAGFSELRELCQECSSETLFRGALPLTARPIAAHVGAITGVALLDSHGSLVSAGEDQSIKLWDLATGALQKFFPELTERVVCLARDALDRFVIGGGRGGSLRLWNLPEGTVRGELPGHLDEIRGLALSRDGNWLASASADQTVRIWDVRSGQPWLTLDTQHEGIQCLALSEDGHYLAGGCLNGQIRIWSFPDGVPVLTLSGHESAVTCLVFGADRFSLVSGSRDRTIRFWHLLDRAESAVLHGPKEETCCLQVSPEGELLASGGQDGAVHLWSLLERKLLSALTPGRSARGAPDSVRCLAFSPDGAVLASGGSEACIRIWSIPGGAPLRALELHRGPVSHLLFSANGQTLISAGRDGQLGVWQSELTRLRRLPMRQLAARDLEWLRDALDHSKLTLVERAWIQYLLALARWRRRHDILLDEPVRMLVGDLDIEIEE